MRNQVTVGSFAAITVAIIALIAALVGTAVALPGKGSVDKDDLKKGAVTKKAIKTAAVTSKAIKDAGIGSADLADGSVTTTKLADGSVTSAKLGADSVNSSKIGADQVTGEDVDESTLGQVQSAASASNVSFLKPINVRLAFGDDIELVRNDEVSIRARCVLNGTLEGGPNRDGIQLYARTTVPGSFLDATDSRRGDNNGDGVTDAESLDPSDPIDESTFVVALFPAGGAAEQNVTNDIDDGFVVAPDGSYIGINTEDLVLALRALGSDCAVIGMAQVQG